jgi:hypothetical protein
MMPTWHAFTPKEIIKLLEQENCEIIRVSAPGTFVRYMKDNIFEKVIQDTKNFDDFMDFVENFDKNEDILGVGAINAGGLLVSAKKKRAKNMD